MALALHLLSCGGEGGSRRDPPNDQAIHDSCTRPYPVDPRDATLSGEPVRLLIRDGGTIDPSDDQVEMLPPQEIVDWIAEQGWPQQHGDWHNTRRWDDGCLRVPGIPCLSVETMVARGLERAAIQEGEPGDGYAFLVMHRHMIRALQQAFPLHADSIRGFEHIPTHKDDPENPIPWLDVNLNTPAFAALEDIENNLDLFPSEDELGRWIQFGASAQGTRLGVGVHGFMHAQWTVPGSPYSLIDNNVNVSPLAFWRLHGWIDDIWERYRRAKGIGEDDPAYQAELVAQCVEMHQLDRRNLEPPPPPDDGSEETGVFATEIAPIFDTWCAGCHGVVAPSQGLVLGGVRPSQVWQSLIFQPSTETAMPLVNPGVPRTSWLMRKLTGDFTGIRCVSMGDEERQDDHEHGAAVMEQSLTESDGCKTPMPVAGVRPSDEEIGRIRAWIAAGADQ